LLEKSRIYALMPPRYACDTSATRCPDLGGFCVYAGMSAISQPAACIVDPPASVRIRTLPAPQVDIPMLAFVASASIGCRRRQPGGRMTEELTELIGRAQGGDRVAADRLFTVVYAELRAIAGRQRQRIDGAGIGATSLVHESYMRLIRGMSLGSEGRVHFFATAARAMRQIAIDRVRAEVAEKRGGNAEITSLDSGGDQAADTELGQVDLIALDQALTLLESFDARLSRLVELRFFAGMSLEEAGEKLGMSERTLKRDWRKARAFLHTQLDGAVDDEP
jgi:RNA polymerase sigma factor (TIGR02999 family)